MNSQMNSGGIIESAQCSFTIHRSLSLDLLAPPGAHPGDIVFFAEIAPFRCPGYQDCREGYVGYVKTEGW